MRGEDWSAFLPPFAERVLHFGEGAGVTGAHFSRIHPGCRYVDGAGTRDPWEALGGEADCILREGEAAADLTAEILREQVSRLSERGQVLLVAEYPGYLRNLMGLLSGTGSPRGRFPGELIRLGREAGLVPHSVQPIFSEEDREERERPSTRRLLEAMEVWRGETGSGGDGDPWAVRHVVRFSRHSREPLFLKASLGEAVVTARPRVLEPGGFLSTVPGVLARAEKFDGRVAFEERPGRKVFLWQRQIFGSAAQAIPILRRGAALGYLQVVEIDDHPSRWEEAHGRNHYLEYRGMHGIQTSTEPLAEYLRRYNPEVAVFPNMLREIPPLKEFSPGEGATVFFGALNREEDWKDILPVLNEVSREYGPRLRFRVLADRMFYDALETEHKEFVGREDYYEGRYVPYEVYTDTLAGADISLLPLRDTEFNRAKSDLKFIESAAQGAAVLASPTVYHATLRDGETGFLYRSPREFGERLRLLIENPNRRRALAEAAYGYVARERMLYQHYEERLAWYEELYARKEELDRALEQRLAQVEAEMPGR